MAGRLCDAVIVGRTQMLEAASLKSFLIGCQLGFGGAWEILSASRGCPSVPCHMAFLYPLPPLAAYFFKAGGEIIPLQEGPSWDVPGGPAAKTLRFQCRDPKFKGKKK